MATLYHLGQTEPFKLSRSKLELFIQCPYCFYLDRRLGVKRPDIPGYTLNNAVDALLKKECDSYRAQRQPHPIAVEYKLEAIPYQTNPTDLLTIWRNKGISFFHEQTNFLLYGKIDDVWVNPNEELIIIDYKATSQNGDFIPHEAYRRQLDIYSWLFKMNGHSVYDKAFWIYCNGIREAEAFGNHLNFKTALIEHPVDTSWVEEKLIQTYHYLNNPHPPVRSDKCDYCAYLTAVEKAKKEAL